VSRSAGRRHRGRRLALRVLFELEGTDKDAAETLRYQAEDECAPADVTHYAQELVYGTLRHLDGIDDAISAASLNWRLEDIGKVERAVLRLGAFELLHHEKVPARAAVNEAVELAKELKAARATGFVNAVLRRLSETRSAPPPPSREVDPVGHLAAITAHPRWMVERWMRWLGNAEAEQLCAANQQQAPATVRVARRKATVARAQEALRASGIESRPGRYSPDALILASGAPPALDIEGYEQGLFQAQDEAAQLVSLFAAPDRSARILDACAAPGGKACHLAEIAERGSVLAVDLHARKAAAVGEAARRLGLENLEARAADVTLPIPDVAFESFDLVLLDSPCSGLGTLRRHPEVKLRRTPDDVDRLAQLQARLLAAVQRYVRPGGLLVHALCTLTPEECDEQVQRFLTAFPQFGIDPPPPSFPPDCLEGEFLRTLPHRTGTDGFFAARLRRTA